MMTKMVLKIYICLIGLQFATFGQSTEHFDVNQFIAKILLPPGPSFFVPLSLKWWLGCTPLGGFDASWKPQKLL